MATAKKVTEKKVAEKKVTEKKERKPGVGALAIELILAGKTTGEILEAIQKTFPESKANSATISWYRGKLKKEGLL